MLPSHPEYRAGSTIGGVFAVVQSAAENPSLRGGMGLVYLCEDLRANRRPVAVKTFRSEFLSKATTRDRFLKEATVWIQLGHHPNIVTAHHILRFTDTRETFLVLDWIPPAKRYSGASLREVLRVKPNVDANQALAWTLEIIRGMKHANRFGNGLVHRDLKPENVLIGADNIVRVTDFGLAGVVSAIRAPEAAAGGGGSVNSDVVAIVGTPQYMPPEQWSSSSIDLRSDVYSLGCILLEMVIGRSPVNASRQEDCRRMHMAGEALRATRIAPARLHGFLEHCLATAPSDRYQTWDEVEEAIETIYESVTGTPAPAAVTNVDSRPSKVRIGYSLISLGAARTDIGAIEDALHDFERALEIAKAEGILDLETAALNELSGAHLSLGNLDSAKQYATAALGSARANCDRYQEAQALGNLGGIHVLCGEWRIAIGYLEEGLAGAREVGDKVGESAALGGLGTAYIQAKDPRRAIIYLEPDLKLSRELGDTSGEGMTLGNLGLAYKNLGDCDRALACYEQNLVLARQTANKISEATVLGNMGNMFVDRDEPERALECFAASLEIASETNNVLQQGITLLNIAKTFALCRECDKADEALGEAATIFKTIGHQEHLASAISLARIVSDMRKLM